jgi:hypothetical protein
MSRDQPGLLSYSINHLHIYDMILKLYVFTYIISLYGRQMFPFHVNWAMVLNTTFNNISAVSWRSNLLVEETRVPGENH